MNADLIITVDTNTVGMIVLVVMCMLLPTMMFSTVAVAVVIYQRVTCHTLPHRNSPVVQVLHCSHADLGVPQTCLHRSIRMYSDRRSIACHGLGMGVCCSFIDVPYTWHCRLSLGFAVCRACPSWCRRPARSHINTARTSCAISMGPDFLV